MIVILGGGLAGLSAAYHLGDRPCKIYERETRPGGLCRSVTQDGFTFDYTGHLLHTRDPYTRWLIDTLLPDTCIAHQRRTAIYHDGRYVPYPFQANLGALETQKAKECLLGFMEAYCKGGNTPNNFRDWIYTTMGKGIAKYFMVPYNEKLWRVPLNEISLEWVDRFVPCPTLEEMVDGVFGTHRKALGYNQEFLYPARGGIETIPTAFAALVANISYGKSAISVNIHDSTVMFEDGEIMGYDTLVSTMPLDELIRCLNPFPAELTALRGGLRYTSIVTVNLGVDREHLSDYHWIYFPEPEYPFYRVGFPANLSPYMAPSGTSSLSVEISHGPAERPDMVDLRKRVLSALRLCGILYETDVIITEGVIDIRHAYVIFDSFRQDHLADALAFLRRHGIYPLGRYGQWTYSAMEDAVTEGKALAETLS